VAGGGVARERERERKKTRKKGKKTSDVFEAIDVNA